MQLRVSDHSSVAYSESLVRVRGSERSHDREGVVVTIYVTEFAKGRPQQ